MYFIRFRRETDAEDVSATLQRPIVPPRLSVVSIAGFGCFIIIIIITIVIVGQ